MRSLAFVFGLALLFGVMGWTWSELPRKMNIFVPTWSKSFQLYQQPHAVWLDGYQHVGVNLPVLRRVLQAAAKARQIPEIVVYGIPLRDLGQSSEGGFANYEDYMADNRLNAEVIADFTRVTGIHPVIYLEPDSIPLAVQYRRDFQDSDEAVRIYQDRMRATRELIHLYQAAGANVYLEAGHSGWFDYSDEDVRRIAQALNEAGIGQADGVASNVSNRQPVTPRADSAKHEHAYLGRLVRLLDNSRLDVRVDTSRNGGPTVARQYFLAPGGWLVDNETTAGRVVGKWRKSIRGEVWLHPFFGPPKPMARLLVKEKYQFNPAKNILLAPPWLDAVGDVQLGPAPTDTPPTDVADVIKGYRYIKPPDDCDGALNCPPGASKSDINAETANRQPQPAPIVPLGLWTAGS